MGESSEAACAAEARAQLDCWGWWQKALYCSQLWATRARPCLKQKQVQAHACLMQGPNEGRPHSTGQSLPEAGVGFPPLILTGVISSVSMVLSLWSKV
jgi:hypothetical protein